MLCSILVLFSELLTNFPFTLDGHSPKTSVILHRPEFIQALY